MADQRRVALALGVWESALGEYVRAAEVAIQRGALSGPPESVDLDQLETLDVEQRDALRAYLEAQRGE